MKSSKILLSSENGQNEETLNKGIKRTLLKSLIFMFLLSSVMLFSSCYATVKTPRYHRPRHNVVIVESDNGGHHDNGNHYGQYKNKKRNKHNRD